MNKGMFQSSNGKDTLLTYDNGVKNPKASLQLIHGMKEHMGRYERVFDYFKEKDVLVFGHDHLGHGPEGLKDRTHLSEGSYKNLIKDVGVVADHYRGDEPHVKLGHSMGSFVLRGYLQEYPEDSFKGAILMGSAIKDVKLLKAGLLLSKTLGQLKGEKRPSNLLYSMSDGSYHKAIKNPKSTLDWLSLNEENIKSYEKDPLSGQPFTIGAYRELYTLLLKVCDQREMEKMNKELPLLLLSGRKDPVGDMGRGIKTLEKLYREVGMKNVEAKLYPYLRHEILQEAQFRTVLKDIQLFILS